MNIKYSIGEFSKIYNVSKQTLIFYDKKEIFKPKITDENNGYRYYTLDQFEKFEALCMLKEIGMPLKEIKNYLENEDISGNIKVLKNQAKKLYKRQKELEIIHNKLSQKIINLEGIIRNDNLDQIIFKSEKRKLYLEREVLYPNNPFEVEIAIKALIEEIRNNDFSCAYQIGVKIDKANLIKKEYLKTKAVYVLWEDKKKIKGLSEKKEGIYAVAYHRGAYNKIGKTYDKIIKVINENNYLLSGDSYERCIIDSFTVSNEKKYITEIAINVERIGE